MAKQGTAGLVATFAFCGELVAAAAGAALMVWRYEHEVFYLRMGCVMGVAAMFWLAGVWRWSSKEQKIREALEAQDLLAARQHVWERRGPDRRQTARSADVETATAS